MENIKIYLRKNSKDTTGIVWVSFYIHREKVNFSTKVYVDEKNWNAKKNRITSGDKFYSDKNLVIENILSRINNVFVKYRLKDKRISRETSK